MRAFNEGEVEAYNKVRDRQLVEVERLTKLTEDRRLPVAERAEAQTQLDSIEVLPEFDAEHCKVTYAENSITTHAFVTLSPGSMPIWQRHGWAVFSPIDQRKPRKMRPPQVSEVGKNVAFSRALHDPLVWVD